jgi:hypothetical protein
MSFDHDAPADDRPSLRRPKRWPAFLAGFLLGGGIAVGVMLALWNQPAWWNQLTGRGRNDGAEVDFHPTEDEVIDYLDGKSVSLQVKDQNVKPKTITIKKANVSEVKWSHGSRLGGSEEPWTHTYNCLYSDEGGAYILDLRIPVRVVGARRVFLPLEEGKVTPVDKIVTPKKK